MKYVIKVLDEVNDVIKGVDYAITHLWLFRLKHVGAQAYGLWI